MQDTIVAISTSLQEGAIAIVRLSGDESIEIVNSMFNQDLTKVKSHQVCYGMIKSDGQTIDEVLVSLFRAPKSYTTEDIVEIHCHGGVVVTRQILQCCLSKGARLALPGEFTQRAFIHGRIDLTQAESVMDLLQAQNTRNAQSAISGIKGSVAKLIQPLCESLLEMIATIEVNIDYPEYDDVEQLTNHILIPKAKLWYQEIEKIVTQAKGAYQIKKGITTVILGKPNVGKSSLLNALIEEDKAIVTEIEGTTRDIVEGTVQCGNVFLRLLDTAGIRDTSDEVEKIGIEKSLRAVEEADLCLVVLDGSQELDERDEEILKKTENKNRIIVYNKKDIKSGNGLSVSAMTKDTQELIDEIEKRFEKQLHYSDESTLNNERQIALAMKSKESIAQAIIALESGIELDLVSIDLQKGYTALKEILGEVSKDDLLDTLFSRFCLGK